MYRLPSLWPRLLTSSARGTVNLQGNTLKLVAEKDINESEIRNIFF